MMFIEIRVNDNSPFTKIGLHRKKPYGLPKKGEMCIYDIYIYSYNDEYDYNPTRINDFEFPYGDGNLLSIEVLNFISEMRA